MQLKWHEPELKSKWNFEQLADAPKEYYEEEYHRDALRGRCQCGCSGQNSSYEEYARGETYMKPRYKKPHYELGTDDASQLRMIWG